MVCVLNAPGRARRLACRSCRALQRCERCQAAVAQTRDGRLRCARCGLERPVVCQTLRLVGAGRAPARGDGAARAGRGGGRAPGGRGDGSGARPAPSRRPTLFVGTEAVLHRVPRADVVAFLDFDDELLAPRFRADEQALALLARAARLARADERTAGACWSRPACPTTRCSTPCCTPTPGRLVGGGTRPASRARPAAGPARWPCCRVPAPRRWRTNCAGLPGVRVVGARRRPLPGASGGRSTLADALASTPRPRARVRVEVDPPRVEWPPPAQARPCSRSRRSACVGDLRAQRGMRRHKSPGALPWVRRARRGRRRAGGSRRGRRAARRPSPAHRSQRARESEPRCLCTTR